MSSQADQKRILLVPYLVGAARQEAEQRGLDVELQTAVRPTIAAFRGNGDPTEIISAIRGVLGEGWEPQGDFREAMEKIVDV